MSDDSPKSADDRPVVGGSRALPDGGVPGGDNPQPVEEVRREVAIRRSPRYARFAIVGCGVGVVTALALTALLPPAPPYSPLQVFGFLMLIIGSVGGALGAACALIFDRLWAGRQIRAIAGRIEANSTQT